MNIDDFADIHKGSHSKPRWWEEAQHLSLLTRARFVATTIGVATTRIENFPFRALTAAREALGLSHARLVRAAARTGQQAPKAPVLQVIAERTESRCAVCSGPATFAMGMCEAGCGGVAVMRRLVDLELVADRPVLASWDFLATIEPMTGGNLIRQVPGADVAEGELAHWRTGAIACDHCATARRRNETFIVRADGSDVAVPAGTYRQVGRQCLVEFLGGQSPTALLAAIGWPALVRGCADEEGAGGGWSSPVFDPTRVLAWTAAACRIAGYISRKASEASGARTTGSFVIYLLMQQFGQGVQEWERLRAEYLPTEADKARATAALAWARSLAGVTDYEANIGLVARQNEIEHKHAGILASIIPAHARVIGDQVEQQSRNLGLSTHQGVIKDKIEIVLTVERVHTFETAFGPKHINTLRDAKGNCYVWKTGTVALTAGAVLTVAATIKAHAEYRGERQTELTRCTTYTDAEIAERDAVLAAKPAKRPRKTKASTTVTA